MIRRLVTQDEYTLEELEGSARERAFDKLREWATDSDWWDAVYDDAANVAKILGIDLMQKPVKLMNGTTRYDPSIWFSGFGSQGDGACFEGSYRYAKGSSEAVRKYAPTDEKLHAIADGLRDVQKRHFYGLQATVEHAGHYSHAYSTTIQVWDDRDEYRDIGDAEEAVKELLRDFMNWIYRQLENEFEYLTSEEQLLEMADANGYRFTVEGKVL